MVTITGPTNGTTTEEVYMSINFANTVSYIPPFSEENERMLNLIMDTRDSFTWLVAKNVDTSECAQIFVLLSFDFMIIMVNREQKTHVFFSNLPCNFRGQALLSIMNFDS